VTHHLREILGIYGGTFAVAIIAGLVPFINTEVFLVWLVRSAVDSSAQLAPIVIIASIGQMIAKIGLYFAGSGLLELPRGRYKHKIEIVRSKLDRWRTKPYFVYAISSVLGLPPFYLTVLAAGALHIRLKAFLAIGLTGRLIRFGVIVGLAWIA
jgi:membrane protein YqaA with SNARE-associated domain